MYTYRITLLKGSLKSCYYLGQHITDDLNDGYRGSGRIVRDYYKKYDAIEDVTYTKDILGFYKNQEELNQAEYELIGDLYKTDPKCLNLRAGGHQAGMCDETKLLLSKAQADNWLDESYREMMHISLTEAAKRPETKKKRSDAKKNNNNAKGSIRTNEMKKHQSEVHKELYKDEEYHKKVSEGTKTGMNKPEVRAVMREKKLGKHWRINPVTNKREWYK